MPPRLSADRKLFFEQAKDAVANKLVIEIRLFCSLESAEKQATARGQR